MPYDPDKHRRHSIRLRGYDYRCAGAYFVTICAQDRQRLFGEVRESEMHLNDAGRMVERWWRELNHKFPSVETDAFVIMPDHIHGIVIIAGTNDPNAHNAINANNANAVVGADLHIRPQRNDDIDATNANAAVGADLHIRPRRTDDDTNDTNAINANAAIRPQRNDDIDATNANAAVGADLHIRPRRTDDDIDDINVNDVNTNADAINVGGYADPPLHVDPDAIADGYADPPPYIAVDANIDAINVGGYADPPLHIDPHANADAINVGGYTDPPLHIDANADTDAINAGASLSQIVQWFKIMTTTEYIRAVKQSGWTPFRKRIWQRDYYEHIIRDERSLDRIRHYIHDNPAHWASDRRSPQKRTPYD